MNVLRKTAALAVAGFIVLFALTVSETTADTVVYVGNILAYSQHALNASPWLLWEFGHLLWRPLGYGLWLTTHPLLSSWSGNNPALEITACLITVNFFVGIGLTLLLFFLSRRLGLSRGLALAVTAGFMLCSVILNYVHSGMSYNFGLAAQLAALLLILEAGVKYGKSVFYAVTGGLALALSFLFWFPYVLTVPAVLLAGWIIDPARQPNDPLVPRSRFRAVAIACATTAIFGLVIFGIGAALGHIDSYGALKRWIVNSAHGLDPERRLSRLPTGVTRSFFYLGNDGLTMKRFTLGDPYAPVNAFDLIRAGIWKVALIFVGLAVLFLTLARRRDTWPALGVLAVGLFPTIAFAVILFETSEPGRYEPAYPSLLVAVCAVLLLPHRVRLARWFLTGFVVILAIVNLKAYAWDLRSAGSAATERALMVHEHTRHGGVAFLLSFRDPVSTYLQKVPFSPLNRQGSLPLFHVIEPGNVSIATWRRDAACRILQAWDSGGEAWLSARLVAQRPKPEWNWAERDDSHVHWADLPAFFTRFETDGRIGGEDGFIRVASSVGNRQDIREVCASPSRSEPN